MVRMFCHFWGALILKHHCSPGRFFTSTEMKNVVAILISKYDFKLAEPNNTTTRLWRTIALPRRDTVLLSRPRVEQ
jgi:hypothetical protein